MQPSSDLCRAQEAHHRARAEAATLDNVKEREDAAAAAWAKEGVAAGMREDRQQRTRATAEALRQQALRADEAEQSAD